MHRVMFISIWFDKLYATVIMISLQAALKAAKQTKDGRDEELSALRAELEVIICSKSSTYFCLSIHITLYSNNLQHKYLIRTLKRKLQLLQSNFMRLNLKQRLSKQWHKGWYWHMKRWLLFQHIVDISNKENLSIWSVIHIGSGYSFSGRSCSEEMLACSLLGFSFTLW